MENWGIFGVMLLIVNSFVTYKGLSNDIYLDKYSFNVGKVLIHKDYKRLLSSGFLHVNWIHFLFNMMTLYCFSSSLEYIVGGSLYLSVYFASLVGGNLFSLYIHRNHPDYQAVGASGAISGIVFASIALFPGMELSLLMLPFSIPSWAFGLLFVLFSIYGIKSQNDNIGHEAHLGGGLIGLTIALIAYPELILVNYIPIFVILVPAIGFLYIIFHRPEALLLNNFQTKGYFHKADEQYLQKKQNKERELNLLLDKINAKGIDSLSENEREKLKNLSH